MHAAKRKNERPNMRWQHALAAMSAVLAMGAAAFCRAEDYPARTIRIIVPFAPGASTDILARIAAQRFSEAWKQQAIVENRIGAAGMIGAGYVAKAPPDGYTLLMATASTQTVTPHTYRKVPYDALKDFAPIALVAWVPNVLTVHPSLPVKNLKEFVAFTRARPDQLLYASSGTGTTLHLAGVLFDQYAGTRMIHVPYKGAGGAMVDLLAGQVHVAFNTVATTLPFINQGKLRALGVTTLKRSTVLPNVPTIAETFPGYEMPNWVGVMAPAGTPRDIIAKLNAELVKLQTNRETHKRVLDLGAELAVESPQAFADVIARGYASIGKLIRAAGINVQGD